VVFCQEEGLAVPDVIFRGSDVSMEGGGYISKLLALPVTQRNFRTGGVLTVEAKLGIGTGGPKIPSRHQIPEGCTVMVWVGVCSAPGPPSRIVVVTNMVEFSAVRSVITIGMRW
jgi:hypothetical protein